MFFYIYIFRPPSNTKKGIYAQKYFEKCDVESYCDESILVGSQEAKKPVPSVPKDPYEFTDVDETAPSEKGFRPIADSFCKVILSFLSLPYFE